MGRGASDLTASALAQAMDRRCLRDLHRRHRAYSPPTPASCRARASSLRVHFDEMLEMAGAGSKVLAMRSVEFARNHDVPLHVRSAFTWEQGTWVSNEEPSVEDPIISGVVTDMTEAKVTVLGVPDRPGVSAALFEPLADVERQRRHDRAEHVDRRHDRHQFHDADGRPRAGGVDRPARGRLRSGPPK